MSCLRDKKKLTFFVLLKLSCQAIFMLNNLFSKCIGGRVIQTETEQPKVVWEMSDTWCGSPCPRGEGEGLPLAVFSLSPF